MCGISGLYSFDGIEFEEIKKMNDSIIHRGPDGEGYFLKDKKNQTSLLLGAEKVEQLIKSDTNYTIAIGHRRLSIVDLSNNGLQPMQSDDGNYVIAFNGEIYNYNELKAELISAGYKFRSSSDTEVLLYAYIHWGKAVLDKLNGMFAFQIYNVETNTLFCARDRFGVKPFYYWLCEGKLAVASEIKQFTCLANWNAYLNVNRAYDFLSFGQTEHTNETMFDGVYQLRPGHYFEITINDKINISPVCWYKLPRNKSKLNFKTARSRFKTLFKQAVTKRIHADVLVGTGLSGGLDSSSIACEINAILKKENKQGLQKTFSACTYVKRYDEKNYIDDVLNKIDAEPHFIYPKPPENIAEIDKIIWHQDEPFGTTSILAEWSVFSLAQKHGVKVTVDGHGADESLAGYHRFFFIYLSELLLKGNIYQFIKESFALKRNHGYSVFSTIKKVLYYWRSYNVNEPQTNDWYKLPVDKASFIKSKLTVIGESLSEFSYSSVPMQLHWCDRDSMAHSVESRAPFLDVNLVEFILSCPSEQKIKNGISKYILRESLKDLLPQNVYNRIGKIGFATPEEEWITIDNKEFFLSLLDDAKQLTADILAEDAFVQAKKIINREIPYNGFAWRIICFANWLKVFDVKIKEHSIAN